MTVSAWTEDRVEALKKLWAEGLSASVISERIGAASRSAVLSKAHSLKLPGRKPRASGMTKARPRRGDRNNGGGLAFKLKHGRKALRRHPQAPLDSKPPARLAEEPTPADAVTLMDLHDHQCHWPFGGPGTFRYCGHPAFNRTAYCKAHSRRVYTPSAFEAIEVMA